jgi:hypothetical protein
LAGVISLMLALAFCISCVSQSNSSLNRPLESFHQKITSPVTRLRLHPSQGIQLPVVVKNTGKSLLTSRGTSPVLVSYIWFSGGTRLKDDSARTILRSDLLPGEEVSINVRVVAPAGENNLTVVITLVQEGVAWFEDQGHGGLIIPVDLEP